MGRAVLGVVLGLAVSALSISGNLRRGDPHLVSIAPDLISAMAIAVLTYSVVRRAIRRQSPGAGREAGMHTAFIASVVCATAMAVFTWWYLPTHAPSLAAFSAIGSFMLVFVVGYTATLADTRSSQRLL